MRPAFSFASCSSAARLTVPSRFPYNAAAQSQARDARIKGGNVIRNKSAVILYAVVLFAACCLPAAAQSKASFVAEPPAKASTASGGAPAASSASPELLHPPGTLFVVGYAHL